MQLPDRAELDQPQRHRLSGYGVTESAARTEGADHRIHGAGVAVSPRHIVTCAHVVLDALGLERTATQTLRPGARVAVTTWRERQPCRPEARLLAAWRPVAAGDLALLELGPAEPDLTPACRRRPRGDEWAGQTVQAYG